MSILNKAYAEINYQESLIKIAKFTIPGTEAEQAAIVTLAEKYGFVPARVALELSAHRSSK